MIYVYPTDCSLEEVVVLYIKNAVCKPLKEDEERQEDSGMNISTKEEDNSTKEHNRSTDGNSPKNRSNKNNTVEASSHDQTDTLLWAAFNETSPQHNHTEEMSFAVDQIARCV